MRSPDRRFRIEWLPTALAAALLAALALPASAAGEDPGGEPPVRFGEIIILRKEVFNPSVPGYDSFPFTVLNDLHVVTREQVVREQLLFKTGMPYDPSLLEESERVLRRFEFINAASIVALEEKDGVRPVVVETMDQWSTNLELEVDRFKENDAEQSPEARRDGYEITLSEANLFGYGKRIRFRSRFEGTRSWLGAFYDDPFLFNTRWTMRLGFQDERRGEDWEALAYRPFYSLATRWSMGGESIFETEENRIYRGDGEAGRFLRQRRHDRAFLGRMYGGRHRKLLAIGEAGHVEERYGDLEPAAGLDSATAATLALPEGESGPLVMGGLRAGRFDFVKENRIDEFARVEDIELGQYGAVRLGRAATRRSRWIVGADASGTWRFRPGQYGSVRSGVIADRREGEWGTTEYTAEVQYHGRLGLRNTLAGRVAFDRLWRGQPGSELFAGENSGLRGYEARSFAGQSRLLLNVEDRLFSDVQILAVAFGAALFVDAASVWEEGAGASWDDIDAAAGGGVRLGFTKSKSASVVRLDVARSLRDGSWRASVASGQLFRITTAYQNFLERFE